MADQKSKNRTEAGGPHDSELPPLPPGVGSWSVAELGKELSQTGCNLRTAEALEAAAERRQAEEATPEAEEAPRGRRAGAAEARPALLRSARPTASDGGTRRADPKK
jgi:hypothetical protein